MNGYERSAMFSAQAGSAAPARRAAALFYLLVQNPPLSPAAFAGLRLSKLRNGIRLPRRTENSERDTVLGGAAKRCMDIIVAGTALTVLSPVMLLTAALVKARMGGPVLFAHERVGKDGKIFQCYKFRTMINMTEAEFAQFLAANPEMEREWRETRKLSRDPRVTRLGCKLRKSSLDELPQLINVLKGDMSCIGPRPVVQAELANYGRRTKFYLAARPGITGLWQVSGRSKLCYRKRVALDTVYVKKWSLIRDMMILLKTVPAVFRFKESA